MKYLKLLSLLFCTMIISAASCEKSDEEENTSDEAEWKKTLNVTVESCKRDGAVLFVDFKIENKTNKNVSNVYFYYPKLTDNEGTTYVPDHRVGNNQWEGGDYSEVNSVSADINFMSYVIYHMRVKDFPTSPNVKTVDAYFAFQPYYSNNYYDKKKILIN